MDVQDSTSQAKRIHDDFLKGLTENGIDCEVWDQTVDAADSIFPDWFITARNSILPQGVFILAAMRHPERRKERQPEIIDKLKARYADFIDLTRYEDLNLALELKGALVTDWDNGKIYCSLS